VFLSTESSGQFLYVINFDGSMHLSVRSSRFILILRISAWSPLRGATIFPVSSKGVDSSNGKVFYAYLNDPSRLIRTRLLSSLDSSNGNVRRYHKRPGATAHCLALDPI